MTSPMLLPGRGPGRLLRYECPEPECDETEAGYPPAPECPLHGLHMKPVKEKER